MIREDEEISAGAYRVNTDGISEIWNGSEWVLILLPCPFCQSNPVLTDSLSHLNLINYVPVLWRVECQKCGANKKWYDDKNIAIEEWNKRK